MDIHASYPGVPIDGKDEIRILTLSAGLKDDPLVCYLSRLRLPPAEDQIVFGESESYDALSYTWGVPQDLGHILLDDIPWAVTQNLLAALRRLRYKDRPHRIWIDQLCIDQANYEERSQQVRLMARVYTYANYVNIWLGDGPGEDWLDPMFGTLDHDTSIKFKEWEVRRMKQKSQYLEDILQRSHPNWWERIWVTQEFAMARRPQLLLFGALCMPVHEVLRWDNPLVGVPEKVRCLIAALKMLRYRMTYSHNIPPRMSFTHLLESLITTTSSDPRDKVFAVLSLLPARMQDHITIDYHRPLAAVFAQATFAAMVIGDSLEMMTMILPRADNIDNLPSWAFDFTTSNVPEGLLYANADFAHRKQMETSAFFYPLRIAYDDVHGRLTIRGIVLDTVVNHIILNYVHGTRGSSPSDLDCSDFDASLNGDDLLKEHRTVEARVENQTKQSWWPHIAMHTPDKAASLALVKQKSMAAPTDCIEDSDHTASQCAVLLEEHQAESVDTIDITGTSEHPPWYDKCITRIPLKDTTSDMSRWDISKPEYSIRRITTRCGFVGFMSFAPRIGDVLILPCGGHAPMVLRDTGTSCWTFLGFVWVDGLSPDELIWMNLPLKLQQSEFVLV